MATSTLKSSLNAITMLDCQEDRTDQCVNAMALEVKDELRTRECVFDWIIESEGFSAHLHSRAMRRGHHYTWEGFLIPIIVRILQCFYAMCKEERQVVVKCLLMADKILRKAESLRDYRISQASFALRHVMGTTIAHVFYKSGIYSKAKHLLLQVPPFLSMPKEAMAVVFYMRAQMLFYSGPGGYVESLKWTSFGLQRNPLNPDLRFLCLQLIYCLWDRQLTNMQIKSATSHMGFFLMDNEVSAMMTFGEFYGLTGYQRNVRYALKNTRAALKRAKRNTCPRELYEIELVIVMNLEVDPHCIELIRSGSQFFMSTFQPEKSYFMEGIYKLYNLDGAYRWLDYRMLLFPELCNNQVYHELVGGHQGPEAARIYKRIAYHYVMFEPELAFRYASKALSLESVDTSNGTQLQIPTYDEKLTIFNHSTELGFYRFMVYYAHTLAYGESARIFLWDIQKLLPSYSEAFTFSQENQKIFDVLLKNEYYRDPFRIPHGGCYPNDVLHIYDED